MKTRFSNLVRFLSLLCLAVWAVGPRVAAQTPPVLDLQLYAGLSITGAVGTVYSVEYVTDLAQTNNASAGLCLEFLQWPASPYLWADFWPVMQSQLRHGPRPGESSVGFTGPLTAPCMQRRSGRIVQAVTIGG